MNLKQAGSVILTITMMAICLPVIAQSSAADKMALWAKNATPEELAFTGFGYEKMADARNEKEEALFRAGIIILRRTNYSGYWDKVLMTATSEELIALGGDFEKAAKYRLAREIREAIYMQNKSKYTVLYVYP